MNDDRERLLQLVAAEREHQERSLLLMRDKSSSDGSLLFQQQQQQQQPQHTTTTTSDVPPVKRRSCWEYESTTPMTTRPHFFRGSPQRSSSWGAPLRRTRSRSLGAHHHMDEQLVLPSHRLLRSTIHVSSSHERIRNEEKNNNHHHHSNNNNLMRSSSVPDERAILHFDDVEDNKDNNDYQGNHHAIHHHHHDDDDIEDNNNDSRHEDDNDDNNGDSGPQVLVAPSSCKQPNDNDNESNKDNSLYISILYGLINASIVLPVLMSFTSIIYRHAAFGPYMPVLVKLTIFSGMMHQVCFSTCSSLPFAVGQVQDAGLIFLSSMTAYMVDYCDARGYNDTVLLATVTVSLSLCTAVLGLGLILIGRWKLAQYIQMLPTSVVGGYLAFIGWFCGVSGVRLMAASTTATSDDNQDDENWTLAQAVVERWPFVLPGILGGVGIYLFVRKIRHMAVLPTCILLLLLLFYLVLYLTNTSIEEATQQGWIRATKDDAPPAWYQTWDYLRLDQVAWSVLPHLLLTELSMIFVVALSSSLDVVAIELELKRPLDYNKELTTVGISNLVSGCTGGYTGSYIFSQTIFSLRAGIRSRTAGFVLAAFQFLVLVLPVPILSFVPNFFFGSLLVMICVDLLYEWLLDVRTRVTPVEYLIDLITFGMIQWLGVEYGILAGVVVYLVCYRMGLNVGRVRFTIEQNQVSSSSLSSSSFLTHQEEEQSLLVEATTTTRTTITQVAPPPSSPPQRTTTTTTNNDHHPGNSVHNYGSVEEQT